MALQSSDESIPEAARVLSAIKAMARPKKSDSVLDIGGGTGLIAEYFARDVQRVVVLDPSKKMLALIKSGKIERVLGFAREMKFKDNSFDIVYCVDAMHHFTNGYGKKDWQEVLDASISEMLRVLKKDGTLVIIEFDTEKPLGKFLAFFENKIMRWKSCFWTKGEFRALFKKHPVIVSISELDSYCYIVKIVKR